MNGIKIKDIMVGEEAVKARAVLDLFYPIQSGVIKDEENLVPLWQHGFD